MSILNNAEADAAIIVDQFVRSLSLLGMAGHATLVLLKREVTVGSLTLDIEERKVEQAFIDLIEFYLRGSN